MQKDKPKPEAAAPLREDAVRSAPAPDSVSDQPSRDAVEAALTRLCDAVLPDPRRGKGRSECGPARGGGRRRKGA